MRGFQGFVVGLVFVCALASAVASLGACASREVQAASPSLTRAANPEALTGLLALVDSTSTAGLHLDLRRFRKAPLYAAILGALHELHALAVVTVTEKACGLSPLEAVDEVVMVGAPRGRLVALATSVGERELLACAVNITHHELTTFATRSAVRVEEMVIVARGGVLYIGDPPAIENALAPSSLAGHAAFAPELVMQGDEVLSFFTGDNEAPIKTVAGSIQAGPHSFAIGGTVEMTTHEAARKAAKDASDALAAARAGAPSSPLAERLANAVKSKDNRVVARLVVEGDEKTQTREANELAGLAVSAVRRYLADARAAAGNVQPGPELKPIAK